MKNMWDERYNADFYYYGTEPNSFLVDNRSLFKGHPRVLCLAEGEGRNAVYLAAIGCSVTAVDQSQIGLDKLQKLAEKNNVTVATVCGDLADYSFGENKWDVIVSIWCHLPSTLRAQVHLNVVNALKPQGFFILEAYTPKQLQYKTGGPSDPDLMPDSALLTKELNGLTFLQNHEIDRIVEEGLGHTGLSAVVQVVAQK